MSRSTKGGFRTTERITAVYRATVCRLLMKRGDGCRELLDAEMWGLSLRYVKCDEIWTCVALYRAVS